MNKKLFALFLSTLLVLSLCLPALADTIRLKDGTIIRGQVIGFKDQQFTVLIGAGGRGRRSRIMLYMEDVDSIEFDTSTGGITATDETSSAVNTPAPMTQPAPRNTAPPRQDTYPTNTQPTQPTYRTSTPSSTSSAPNFFQVNTRVRADNTTNGWTNTGLVVRRGQRLRIRATGIANLGGGRSSGPTGIATLPDKDKLMRNEPTGSLIAVIGDDNDDFIFIGSSREFTATRDGVLFLGVNEGNLADNTGGFDVVIEAEATGGMR